MQVGKWGNSLAVRIPAPLSASLGLAENDAIDVREEDGRLVISKQRPKIDLDALIDRITPENRHETIDWGPPVGKEIW